jgi:hypothetical protein
MLSSPKVFPNILESHIDIIPSIVEKFLTFSCSGSGVKYEMTPNFRTEG